jgi:GDPmannose 4,6-dehydratase
LADLLLTKGYAVHGLVRWASTSNTDRIDHIKNRITLHVGDLSDGFRLAQLLDKIQPDEIYNLAALSHVRVSFEVPEYTADITGVGSLRLLEAVRDSGARPRIYQASSSEMFGSSPPPQSETTPFHPRSPYGCAKVFAYNSVVNYREAYGMHASNGILFNHESPRRGLDFVTRKITRAVARIQAKQQDFLHLGNLDAKRDWGFAGDFVEAMWRIVQHPEPDDFVIATGEMHTVREFADLAFKRVGLDWEKYVRYDQKLCRPTEVDALCGDATKARQVLGWTPKTSFEQLVDMMVDADVETL